jgi:hypothetical protein
MREDLKPKPKTQDPLAVALWRVIQLGQWSEELRKIREGKK